MSFFLDLWVVSPNKKMPKKAPFKHFGSSDPFFIDIAKRSYGMENPIVDRKSDERGRPKIIEDGEKKAQQNLYTSASHSDNWSFLTFSSNNVSVDTEWINPNILFPRGFSSDGKHPKKIDIMALANRYFSKREIKILENQKDHEKIATFFQWWTTKEAYIKSAGLKLLTGIKTSTDNIPSKWTWKYFLFDRENLENLCKIKSDPVKPNLAKTSEASEAPEKSSQKLALTIMWENKKNQTENIGINFY